MIYELSPLLSAIAGASATIVAIIGGFIASKLISLSSERSEVDLKSSEINDEIIFLEDKIISGQNKIDEEDALSFIDGQIDMLISKKCLTEKYDDIIKPTDFNFEKMSLYWERALGVYERLSISLKATSDLNEDDIPVSLAKELGCGFEYEVCKLIVSEFNRHKSYLFQMALPKLQRVTGLWYRDLENEVCEMSKRLEWLKILSNQLSVREKALKKPKGMVVGLLLLMFFSFTGIILPLFHLNIVTRDFQVYSQLRYTFIGLLCTNLILTFLYFIYLLLWKTKGSR